MTEEEKKSLMRNLKVVFAAFLFIIIAGSCVRGCSKPTNSRSDDTWETLQHHVDKDTYYDQWR